MIQHGDLWLQFTDGIGIGPTMGEFEEFLKEYGITEEAIQTYMDAMDVNHLRELQTDIYHKGPSDIHGVGIFTSRDVAAGELIGEVSFFNMVRTALGRWVNHSKTPNALVLRCTTGAVLYECRALEDIPKGLELTVNYKAHLPLPKEMGKQNKLNL